MMKVGHHARLYVADPAELFPDVGEVVFDRALADAERVGQLLVRGCFGEQVEDLRLAWAQVVESCHCFRDGC